MRLEDLGWDAKRRALMGFALDPAWAAELDAGGQLPAFDEVAGPADLTPDRYVYMLTDAPDVQAVEDRRLDARRDALLNGRQRLAADGGFASTAPAGPSGGAKMEMQDASATAGAEAATFGRSSDPSGPSYLLATGEPAWGRMGGSGVEPPPGALRELDQERDRIESINSGAPAIFEIDDSSVPDRTIKEIAGDFFQAHGPGWSAVKRHDAAIQREADHVGIDPDLMRAVIYMECRASTLLSGQRQPSWPVGLTLRMAFVRPMFPALLLSHPDCR